MEIIYTWGIEQMQEVPQQGPLTDVVINISWRRYATTVVDGKEYIGGTFGFFVCSQPSSEDFTPYEDLTREQVIGWLEAGLDLESIDKTLIAQLNDQINPPVIILPLPWEPTTTTTEAPVSTTTTTEAP
jgi:hypothetical protein